MRRLLRVLSALVILFALSEGQVCHACDHSHTAALDLLMRLFDEIAARNPNPDDTSKVLAELDPQQREKRLDAIAEQNARDPGIASLIDSLLESDAYKMYYRQFSNVTPDVHRRIFAALPYRGIPSPAGIGQVQLQLFRHRDSIPVLVERISQVDIANAVEIARRWVPPGETSTPATYYILDGSGDAFAGENAVCFDLYGVLLSERPASSRYDNLAGIPTADIEAVLAHEFQHVFAQPHLYPPTRRFDNWQDLWEDVIIRRIVSEGVAMQCNPLSGFKKAIFEDSAVVCHWLRELERVIGQIRRNETGEDSVRAWLERSYHESAQQLLAEYLKRTFPESDQRTLLRDHLADRPSAVYTLGWWMISHIAAASGGHDLAIQLLATPGQLFRLYNTCIAESRFKIAL